MTTTPVRPEDVPARPWLTADAERWAAARLPAWASRKWPALVLPVVAFAALVESPDTVCTVSAPCGPQWADAAVALLFFCHLAWLWLVPELALLSAPLVLAAMTDGRMWTGGTGEKAADVAVIAVVCWSWVSAFMRLLVRRRQHALALDASGGLTFDAPEPPTRSRRGRALMATGLVLLAYAAVFSALSVHMIRSDEAKATTAAHVRAVIVGSVPDEALLVRFEGGEPAGRHRIDAMYPEHYDMGGTVPVLVNGGWMRLAAEPYHDLVDRQLKPFAAAALGSALLAGGLLAAARARSLTRTPAPALRVLTRRRGGRTQIFAADDTDGRRPLLSYEPQGDTRAALREAVLYGAPREGAELLLLSDRTSGAPAVETSAFPARQEGAEHRRAEDRALNGERTKSARLRRHQETKEAEILVALATMGTAKGPVSWKGGPVARIFGALMLCLVAGVVAGLLSDAGGTDITHWLGALCGGSMAAVTGVPPLIWRITADAAGLRIRRFGRSRQLPWADITRAVYTDGGHLIVRTRSGLDDINLGSVGFPQAERAFGVPARAARAATEITAMVRDPALRPSG